MPLFNIPKRIDVFVHFDKLIVEHIDTAGDMTAAEEKEVEDKIDDLNKTADPVG